MLDLDALPDLLPLFRQIVDLKRLRTAEAPSSSLAERLFLRAWTRLLAGKAVEAVALRETAAALVATRLAGIDAGVLAGHSLAKRDRQSLLAKALRDAAAPLGQGLAQRLEAALPDADHSAADAPPFALRLADQPRAGVTCPGKPRLVLAPAESHADHCASVAVLAACLAPLAGADPAEAFLVGIVHHLHNATLPDAGHAGDVFLSTHGAQLMDAAQQRVWPAIPEPLRRRAQKALAHTQTLGTPEAYAFQAADVLDRVLEIEWHARSARFTMDEVLGEMNLVHEGFAEKLHAEVLEAGGLA